MTAQVELQPQPARAPHDCKCKWAAWHATQTHKAAAALALSQCDTETWRELANKRINTTHKRDSKTGIPPLKPHRVPQYIAAIARAVASGRLTAAQGNGLLYAAQIMISLMRREQPPPPTPTVMGFTAPKKGCQSERTSN